MMYTGTLRALLQPTPHLRLFRASRASAPYRNAHGPSERILPTRPPAAPTGFSLQFSIPARTLDDTR